MRAGKQQQLQLATQLVKMILKVRSDDHTHECMNDSAIATQPLIGVAMGWFACGRSQC